MEDSQYIKSIEDLNLYLASLLITGLAPLPKITDYFKQDQGGVYGSQWMQEHFTAKVWYNIHHHLHWDVPVLCNLIRENIKTLWKPFKSLVVDEIIAPFKEDGDTDSLLEVSPMIQVSINI